MSDDDAAMTALDARMRRLLSGLDAREGFEERLRARIAALAPRTEQLAQLEASRLAARRRLRRESWANGLTTAGIGIAGVTLVWRFAPEIGRFADGMMASVDPLVIGGATLAILALALWPFLRTVAGLRLG